MTTKTTGTIKGFIVDLDGVIVFTDKLHYQAWKRMADRLGMELVREYDHAVQVEYKSYDGSSCFRRHPITDPHK